MNTAFYYLFDHKNIVKAFPQKIMNYMNKIHFLIRDKL